MKFFLYLVGVVYLLAFTYAAQDHKNKIKLTAQLLEDAAVKEDWSTVLGHIYPKYIEAYGGKDNCIRKYKSEFSFMNSNGNEYSLKRITVGEPGNEVKVGSMLYSFVPEIRIFRLNGTNYQMLNYLTAISSDGGARWTFLVGQRSDRLKVLLPDLNKLNIPKAGPPRALSN